MTDVTITTTVNSSTTRASAFAGTGNIINETAKTITVNGNVTLGTGAHLILVGGWTLFCNSFRISPGVSSTEPSDLTN